MSEYEIRTTGLVLVPKGESIFSERAWSVSIDTEGAGEYVVVRDGDDGKIRISPDEWMQLIKTIDQLMRECKEDR